MNKLLLIFSLSFAGLFANAQTTIQCDTNLWQHVYHRYRLQVKEECKTVAGTVMAVKREKDGDYHIRVQLDSSYDGLLNEKNISAQHGCLVAEIICGCEVAQTDAIEPCNGFVNNVRVPKVGEHASFTGSYVYDSEHGWMELHPVTKITLTQ